MTEHIKMPDVAPLVRYLADGAQTQFTYPFPIFISTARGNIAVLQSRAQGRRKAGR